MQTDWKVEWGGPDTSKFGWTLKPNSCGQWLELDVHYHDVLLDTLQKHCRLRLVDESTDEVVLEQEGIRPNKIEMKPSQPGAQFVLTLKCDRADLWPSGMTATIVLTSKVERDVAKLAGLRGQRSRIIYDTLLKITREDDGAPARLETEYEIEQLPDPNWGWSPFDQTPLMLEESVETSREIAAVAPTVRHHVGKDLMQRTNLFGAINVGVIELTNMQIAGAFACDNAFAITGLEVIASFDNEELYEAVFRDVIHEVCVAEHSQWDGRLRPNEKLTLDRPILLPARQCFKWTCTVAPSTLKRLQEETGNALLAVALHGIETRNVL